MTIFQSHIKLLFLYNVKKAHLATARFYKMYQCQYRCEVDSNTHGNSEVSLLPTPEIV